MLVLGLTAAAEGLRPAAHYPVLRQRSASPPTATLWNRLRGKEGAAIVEPAPPLVPGELTLLAGAEEYEAKIEQAKAENRVVVIKFYASWCRACKAMGPKYVKVAQDWPELEFCEMLYDNNKKLCKELGIKVLPYIEATPRAREPAESVPVPQIVAGNAGKVDGFSCGPSKISKLIERLEVHGGCEDEIPCTSVAEELQQYSVDV
eukprot:scaffold170867_cov35-Tisochrysis_lutea.AAC.1